jgi:hypothetical protein
MRAEGSVRERPVAPIKLRAAVAVQVRVGVERAREGDHVVELVPQHRVEVEREALELHAQDVRELAEAETLRRVRLALALFALVLVVARELFGLDVLAERLLQRRDRHGAATNHP